MDETLLEIVAQATSLPKERVIQQLKAWLVDAGKNSQDPTLEDLREVLIPILQNLSNEVVAGENSHIKLSG